MTESHIISSDGLFARLDELGIVYENPHHQPYFTVQQSQALRGKLEGGHIKNLFLRDKKRRMWLITVEEDRKINLKALRRSLAAQGNLSFGSSDLLMESLGVLPGAVTPFAIINDSNRLVTLVLDQALLEHSLVNAHPLRNDMTTVIASKDLMEFAKAELHVPVILDFDEPI